MPREPPVTMTTRSASPRSMNHLRRRLWEGSSPRDWAVLIAPTSPKAGALPGAIISAMVPAPRRAWTSAVVPDLRGVALGRMEEEDRLWRGMKDRFAYVIPERGSSEVLYRGRTYRVEPGTVLLKQPGEIYRHLRRDRPATFDVVLVELAEVAAARA